MYKIEGTTITMVRGDSVYIQVGISNQDGTAYTPESGDVIRFAVKKNFHDADTVIEKTIPNDTLLLELLPNDTKGLEFGNLLGKYRYDIQLTKADGTVDTFIPMGTLIILEEVD